METHFPYYTRSLIPNARRLRREMTDAEKKLWSLVRGKQLGAKVRRQVPFGPYIVDFLCEEKKLIIELDGSQHFTPEGKMRDKIRDSYLREKGYRVMRITNYDVLRHTNDVLDEIEASLETELEPTNKQLQR